MTAEEKSKLTDLKKCDFTEMSDYFKAQSEARKAMSKDEKLVKCYAASNWVPVGHQLCCPQSRGTFLSDSY